MDDSPEYDMEAVLALLRDRGIGFEEMHHVPVFTIDWRWTCRIRSI